MSDYQDKINDWRDAARRKARELDERYEIRHRVEQNARAATDAARKSAEAIAVEAKRMREEAERLAAEASNKFEEATEKLASGSSQSARGETSSDAAKSDGDNARAARGKTKSTNTDDAPLNEAARRAAADAMRVAEDAKRAAGEARQAATNAARKAGETAREASNAFASAARASGERAGKIFDDVRQDARRKYKRASRVYETGAGATRAAAAFTASGYKAQKWARENPGKAFLLSLSVVAGIRTGTAFPNADRFLFGAHPHWFTHSALPVYATRKLSEKFDDYLLARELLIASGNLTEAERERARFQREAVRLVGAPLLGAFSCAMGAALWAQIFKPDRIVGAPVRWLLGGNPVLDGIWLFANGVVCFQQGYKFFTIALRDNKEAEKIVKELRGLLPESIPI